MTLTEFLLTRLAEDEEVARHAALSVGRTGFGTQREASGSNWGARYHIITVRNPEPGVAHREIFMGEPLALDVAKHVARHDPARVLAEVETKRRIVHDLGGFFGLDKFSAGLVEHTLRLLALPYADHPDFDPEWRI